MGGQFVKKLHFKRSMLTALIRYVFRTRGDTIDLVRFKAKLWLPNPIMDRR